MRRFPSHAQLGFLLLFLLLSLSGWAQAPEELVDRATKAEGESRFLEAAQAWEKAAAALVGEGLEGYRAQAFFFAGMDYYKVGQKEPAMGNLTQAAAAFSALDDPQGLSVALLQKGIVEIELSRWSDAESSFRTSVESARKAGNDARALEATEWLGKTLEAAHRWPEATEVTEELLAAFRPVNSEKVPPLLSTLGALYQLQSQPEKAEKAYLEAIDAFTQQGRSEEAKGTQRDMARFFQQTHQDAKAEPLLAALSKGDPKNLALAVDHAYALAELGRHPEALARIEALIGPAANSADLLPVLKARKVVELFALGRDKEGLAYLRDPGFGTDSARAQVAESVGRRDLCEEYLRKGLQAATPAQKPTLANALAIKLIRWDKPEPAAELLKTALDSLPRGDAQRAVLLSNLGETYLSRGAPSQALPLYLEALEMARGGVGEADLGTLLSNLGSTYEYLGDYSQALRYLEEAVQVGERYKTSSNAQGTVYNSMGLVYVKMGRYDDGVAFYQRALAYHRTHANDYGETASLINLGAVYQLKDERAKAADYFSQALAIAKREGRLAQQITLLNNLGQLAPRSEDAIAYYQEALTLEKTAPQALTRNILLSNLADTWLSQGRIPEAEELATQAAAALQELGAKENELITRQVLISTSLSRDDASLYKQLDRALELSEDIVAGLSSASARSFLKEHEGDLRLGLAKELRDGQVQRAFGADEQLRNLGLAALTNGLPLESAHLPAELVEREKTLRARIRDASLRSADLAPLKAEQKLVSEQMERFHLAAGALHSLEPAKLADVQAQLHPDEVMLEYLLTGPDVWLLAITDKTAQALRIGELKTLEPLITAAFRRCNTYGHDQLTQAALAELSEALWLPGQALAKGKARLIVIPAGPLYSVPFAALQEEGHPLIERYFLSQATSATAWVLSRRSPADGKGAMVAALGNCVPDWSGSSTVSPERSSQLIPLPGTLKEVLQVAAALKTTDTLKEKAMTGDALRDHSSGRRVLHFATHGLLDLEDPMRSGLVASDRLVSAAEIFNWKLDADLAVLSACNSGRISQGQEYVSLTRAFGFAGARTMLATGWSVSDVGTAEWMKAFYAALESGKPADQSAQLAYLAVRQSFAEPYFWAPFVLWGDGTVSPAGP